MPSPPLRNVKLRVTSRTRLVLVGRFWCSSVGLDSGSTVAVAVRSAVLWKHLTQAVCVSWRVSAPACGWKSATFSHMLLVKMRTD